MNNKIYFFVGWFVFTLYMSLYLVAFSRLYVGYNYLFGSENIQEKTQKIVTKKSKLIYGVINLTIGILLLFFLFYLMTVYLSYMENIHGKPLS
jgi:uncharacterized membrane protein